MRPLRWLSYQRFMLHKHQVIAVARLYSIAERVRPGLGARLLRFMRPLPRKKDGAYY